MPYKFRQSQVLAPSRKMVRHAAAAAAAAAAATAVPGTAAAAAAVSTRATTHPARGVVVIRFQSSFARATGCETNLPTCPARVVVCRSPSATAR
eukprot:COSAG02_NODE_631_length_19290_cov_67.062842_9_plen_94_part_00